MSIKLRWAFLFVVGVILVLVACENVDELVPAVLGAPAVPAAPDSVVARVAVAYGDDVAAVAVEPATGCGDGTQWTVNLQDPGAGGQYKFDPDRLVLKAGESVSYTLKGETEFHTFTIAAFGIDEPVGAGETVTGCFTFSEPGEYELICIPHQALGMVGTIVVE